MMKTNNHCTRVRTQGEGGAKKTHKRKFSSCLWERTAARMPLKGDFVKTGNDAILGVG